MEQNKSKNLILLIGDASSLKEHLHELDETEVLVITEKGQINLEDIKKLSDNNGKLIIFIGKTEHEQIVMEELPKIEACTKNNDVFMCFNNDISNLNITLIKKPDVPGGAIIGDKSIRNINELKKAVTRIIQSNLGLNPTSSSNNPASNNTSRVTASGGEHRQPRRRVRPAATNFMRREEVRESERQSPSKIEKK